MDPISTNYYVVPTHQTDTTLYKEEEKKPPTCIHTTRVTPLHASSIVIYSRRQATHLSHSTRRQQLSSLYNTVILTFKKKLDSILEKFFDTSLSLTFTRDHSRTRAAV